MSMKVHQDDFDNTIGRLDRVLSKLVLWGKQADLDLPNKQTLKHHAEDMVAAGEKILRDLGAQVDGTPQPVKGSAGIDPCWVTGKYVWVEGCLRHPWESVT